MYGCHAGGSFVVFGLKGVSRSSGLIMRIPVIADRDSD
jgi:hypothetical protein